MRVIKDMEVKRVIRVPPRNSQLPRSASIEANEKQTNTKVVPSRAVTMMDGSTKAAYCSSGPVLMPRIKYSHVTKNKVAFGKAFGVTSVSY